MKNIILAIGRNRIYPYVCVLLVMLAFLYTEPFTSLNLRYSISFIGAVSGLLCVILLAKRRNSGNVLGLFAAFGESTANILGGNIGASLPSFYYFVAHVYGLITWHKNKTAAQTVTVRSLNERYFIAILLFLIAAVFLNAYLTIALGVENTIYQLITNCLIFGLGVVAQLLLMMRFSFNWYLWIIVNILIIGLNVYTNNPIITTQYFINLFNAIYGTCEWKQAESKNNN